MRKLITILFLLIVTLGLAFGQEQPTTVEVHGLKEYKSQSKFGKLMQVIGASGIVTYLILKENYNDKLSDNAKAIQNATETYAREASYHRENPAKLSEVTNDYSRALSDIQRSVPNEIPKEILYASGGALTIGFVIDMTSLNNLGKRKR